jgi:anaerobic selenocysteine-containing dehydrogenase
VEWFKTPSGRGELVPVPVFTAPAESRAHAAEGKYPLEFLPRKADNYMNSTFANLPPHQRMEARTAGVLEMHATDAAARGIVSGDEVEVFNGREYYAEGVGECAGFGRCGGGSVGLEQVVGWRGECECADLGDAD